MRLAKYRRILVDVLIDSVYLAGVGCLSFGVYRMHKPAGIVVLGALLMLTAYIIARAYEKGGDR